MSYLIAGIGGIFGSITRYKLGRFVSERSDSIFPIGTFLINISGAFLLGIVSNIGLSSNYEKLNAIAYFGITLVLGIILYATGAYITKILV